MVPVVTNQGTASSLSCADQSKAPPRTQIVAAVGHHRMVTQLRIGQIHSMSVPYPGLLLIGATALLLSGCIPATSDDYAYIKFKNDTDHPVVIDGCSPNGEHFGKDCEGNPYDGSDEPIQIQPGRSVSTSMATGLSIWHNRKTDNCFIVVGWNGVDLTVPISRGRPCEELEDDYQDGLCPDSSSPDGWWHRNSDDGKSCARKRRAAGLGCDSSSCNPNRPAPRGTSVAGPTSSTQRRERSAPSK